MLACIVVYFFIVLAVFQSMKNPFMFDLEFYKDPVTDADNPYVATFLITAAVSCHINNILIDFSLTCFVVLLVVSAQPLSAEATEKRSFLITGQLKVNQMKFQIHSLPHAQTNEIKLLSIIFVKS